jgi:PAS domain S-box-containing protein
LTGLHQPVDSGAKMSKPLRVLNLETSSVDTELLCTNMTEGGIDFEMVTVQTRADFVAALEDGGFDLILAGYPVPSMDGLSALELTREVCPEVPVIVVSSKAGEELAIDSLKSGATDYVLRYRLERLVPAVRRAIRESEVRSERARAEETLRTSEQQFRTLVEQIPAVTYTQQITEPGKSKTKTTLYASPQIESQLGYPPQAFVEDPRLWIRLLHPEDRERVLAEDRRTDATGEPFVMEYRQIARDGRVVWLRDQAVLVRDEEGRPRYWKGVQHDITKLKRVEEELDESEERFRATFEQAAVGITHNAPDGSWLRVNQRFCDIVGYSREELLQKAFQDITHPEDLDADLEQKRRLLAGEIDTYSMEKRYIRKDGSVVWINLTVSLVRALSGEPSYFIAVIEDITERKQAEEALRRQADILEQTHDAILGWEFGGAIVYWNQGAEFLYGWSKEEATGCVGDELLKTERQLSLEELESTLRREGRWEGLAVHHTKDGRRLEIETRKILTRYGGGPDVVLETNRDVTQRKEAEEALTLSEQRFRAIFEQALVGIVQVSLDGGWVSFNERFCEIIGYTREELPQMKLRDILTPEDLRRDLRRGMQMLDGGFRHYSEEKRIRQKDDSLKWVNLTVSLIYSSGEPEYFVGVVEDISERKRTQEALRQSEELYRTVVEQAAENIFMVDLKTKHILETNAALSRSLGYSPEELRGMSLYDILAHTSKSIDESVEHLIARRHHVMGERLYRRKDGTLVDMEVNASIVPYGGREVMGIVAHDITQRKWAEESLRQSLSVLLALRQAGQILSSTLASEEIVSRLLEIMRGVSNLTTAVISVPDQKGSFRIWQSAGLDSLWARVRFSPKAEAARQAALTDGEHHLFHLPRPGASGESLVGLCLPLGIKERVIGVLEAYGPESLADTDSVELLSSLAGQAASALENAQLYEELEKRERMLHDLVGKLMRAQEEERRRVAYEVHDGLAQIAVAAHQRLQAFAGRHTPATQRGRQDLDRILGLVRATVSDARRIIANLRPTTLDDLGLAATLLLEVDHLRENGYQVEYYENLGDQRLPDSVEIALYRSAQEALTNMRKYAHTRRVRIWLGHVGNEVRLEVQDYGRGFDPNRASSGPGPGERVGLAGMRERIGMFGGKLEIDSRPGAGTFISVTIPLPPAP